MRFLVLLAFFLTGCNIYSYFDRPSGNDQILSKARACLDESDYACASFYYERLFNTNFSDVARLESVFLILSQMGFEISSLVGDIINNSNSIGSLITSITDNVIPNSGASARVKIFNNYKSIAFIHDIRLQGFGRFINSVLFIAEIFAESSIDSVHFYKTDLVQDPVLCASSITASGCSAPAGSKMEAGSSISLSIDPSALLAEVPSLNMIVFGMFQLSSAVSQIEGYGNLNSQIQAFESQVTSNVGSIQSNESQFRQVLIQWNIGG